MSTFQTVLNYIYEHRGVATLIAGLVSTSAVGSLPDPTPTSSAFYLWFYNFSHSLVSAIKVVRPTGQITTKPAEK